MHLLVTGGAGFMGSNFIRYVLEHYPEYRVTNFDKLTYAGNPANVADVAQDARYQFVKGDIAHADELAAALKNDRFDAIINYAAETHVDRSILDPEAFLYTDVIGSYRLLEAVRKFEIPRLVQISTDEVFGSTPDAEFSETSAFEPNSPYAASKAGGDLLCRAYVKTYGAPVIVTHSCNFYGPYQYPEKLISLAITNLLEGKSVPVYGAGDQVREWIFTQDHCRAIDAVVHRGVPGEVYNIGSGERTKNIDVVRQILQLLGLGEERIQFVKDRPGHDLRYAIDHRKLTKELDWQPATTFTDGLAQTVAWYQAKEQWWKPLKSGEYLEYYKKQYGAG